MKSCGVIAVGLFWWAMSVTAASPLTITASPFQSFAPATVTVRVQIEPHADNRALEIVAESSAYYRSSRVPLDGASAPRTTSVEIRNLPSGTYELHSFPIDSVGHPRATARASVVVLE